MKKPVMILADYDDTLIRTDSFANMMKKEKWYLNPVVFRAGVLLLLTKLVGKDETAARNRMKYELLKKYHVMSSDRKEQYAQQFTRCLNQEVIAAIKECEHDLLVIISASEKNLIEGVLAGTLAYDYIIANELTDTPEQFRTCYGAEKVRRLQEAIPDYEKYSIIVWTDSESDRPIMNLAEQVHLIRRKNGK